MKIRNNTYQPLAIRIKGLGFPDNEEEDSTLIELEPEQEEEVEGRFLEELVIEESREPHLVTQVELNEN